MPNILSEIRSSLNILSDTQRRVADHILANSENVLTHTLSDIAQACGTSEPTVLRFLNKMGFSSFQLFRIRLARDGASTPSATVYEDIQGQDSPLSIKSKVIQSSLQAIRELDATLDPDDVAHAADLIRLSGRILLFGVGGSAPVAADAWHKLLRLGLRAVWQESFQMMLVTCTHAAPDDLLLAVSHSGESQEVIACAEAMKLQGGRILTMTSFSNSSLTRLSDLSLVTPAGERHFHTDAMLSRIMQSVTLDMVYIQLVLSMGEHAVQAIDRSRQAVARFKT